MSLASDQQKGLPEPETTMSDGWPCPLCGEGTVRRTKGLIAVSFRDSSFQVPFCHDECDACGEQFLTPDELDNLNRRAAALRARREDCSLQTTYEPFAIPWGSPQERLEKFLGLVRRL